MALALLLPFATPLLAGREDDDPSADVSPSPSPAHRHHHHPSPSPSPIADQPFLASGDSGADASPTPRKKHHHLAGESPTPAKPTPTVTADDSDSSADTSPTPHKKHHHRFADDSPTPASPSPAATPDLPSPTPKPHPSSAPDASLDTDQLQDFSQQPQPVQTLIESALALTHQNLTYTFSSADPANGGMDCSGFIYYVLTQAGLKDVPRDASGQYTWLRKAGAFRAVISRNLDGFELDELKPGDLLFWSGTYHTDHDPPVTHTMIYLGREKDTGNRVMVGSTDGRSYHGLQRWGVSVFDFKAASAASPAPGSATPRFIGYGTIPGL